MPSKFSSLQQPLCTRQHLAHPLIAGTSSAQRPGKRLEDRLNLVMIAAPIHRLHMHIRFSPASKTIEEIRQQLTLQVPDQSHLYLIVDDICNSPTQIHCSNCECL